jgi:hypothetical protein
LLLCGFLSCSKFKFFIFELTDLPSSSWFRLGTLSKPSLEVCGNWEGGPDIWCGRNGAFWGSPEILSAQMLAMKKHFSTRLEEMPRTRLAEKAVHKAGGKVRDQAHGQVKSQGFRLSHTGCHALYQPAQSVRDHGSQKQFVRFLLWRTLFANGD